MPDDAREPILNISMDDEVIDGRVWLMIECEDYTTDWDEMPERVWKKYHRTQRIIQSMGGTFEYHVEYGKGVEIKVRLPVKDLETSRLYKKWICDSFPKWQFEWQSGEKKKDERPDFY